MIVCSNLFEAACWNKYVVGTSFSVMLMHMNTIRHAHKMIMVFQIDYSLYNYFSSNTPSSLHNCYSVAA